MSNHSDGFDTGRIQKYCPKCKRKLLNSYLFEGKWYCFHCVRELVKRRNEEYYDKLHRENNHES